MAKSETGFWSWYFGGIKLGFREFVKMRWVRSYIFENIVGVVILAGASCVLSVWVDPLWLLLTMPLGMTIIAHSYWRETRGGK